jgi:hypothetical protein
VAALIDAETPAPAALTGQVAAEAGATASRYSTTGDMIKARMPQLVKGAGLASQGGNTLLTDQGDILTRSAQAALDIRVETARGFQARASVVKSLSPSFLSQFGHLATALQQPSMAELFSALPGGADVFKSFTAGNLGLPGAVYGNTPFNLLAPSRLIYPVGAGGPAE